MTEKKLAKCKRAVQALRAGKGEFVAAERACDEARQAGVPHPVITSVWSEGMPGGLGALKRRGKHAAPSDGRPTQAQIPLRLTHGAYVATFKGTDERFPGDSLGTMDWEITRDGTVVGELWLSGAYDWKPSFSLTKLVWAGKWPEDASDSRSKNYGMVFDGSAFSSLEEALAEFARRADRLIAWRVAEGLPTGLGGLGSTGRGRAKQKRYSAPLDTRREEQYDLTEEQRIAQLLRDQQVAIDLELDAQADRKHAEDGLGAAPTAADPFGSYLGFPIRTLNGFFTPYYYAEGPNPLGSIAHFQSVRQLKNYMNRMVKAGKLVPRDATDLAGLGFPEEDHQELAEMMRGGAQGSEAMAEHALAAGDCATAFEALLELYAQTARANAHGAAGSNYTPLSTNIQLASLFKRKCMNVR